MPVFARDIAVFREIGLTYGNITFYTGDKPEGIARQFLKWKSNLAGKPEKEGFKDNMLKSNKRSSENHN